MTKADALNPPVEPAEWRLPSRGSGGRGLPHRYGNGALHDLRRGLSFLYRQKSQRALPVGGVERRRS